MSSDIVTMLIILGFGAVMCMGALVVFGLGYFFIIRPNIERTKVVNQNWEKFAREKSLTYTKGGRPIISGLYHGRQVKLAVINPDYDFDGPVRVTAGRTAKSSYLLTRASTAVKEADLELKVYKRGPFDQAESGQDLGIGNEAFDAKFRIHCSSPDRVKSILEPEVQSALQERQINLLDFQKGTLNLNAIGVESRPEVLEAFLELVCGIADAIEKH
jgi:hypothetical protein